MKINTNIPALRTVRMMAELQRSMSQSLRRLASGKRITEARDDAAGLAIGEGLKAQVSGLQQAARSINQAFGYLETADGILSTQTELVQRMRELAIQGANGTLSQADRTHLETELLQLVEEFNRVSEQATFNGSYLLDGSFEDLSLQAGTQKGDTIDFSLEDSRGTAVFTEISTTGLGSFTNSSTINATSTNTKFFDVGDDGDEDIITSSSNFTLSILSNDGQGAFTGSQTITDTNFIVDYDVGDVNSDGLDDLVYVEGNFNIVTYLQDANGVFNKASSFVSGFFIDSPNVELRDANGDGIIDIVGTDQSYINAAPGIHTGNNNGTFNAALGGYFTVLGEISGDPTRLADLNNDGILDAYIIDNLNDRLGYALGNADGTWQARQTITQANYDFNSTPTDLNGDGYLDFIGHRSTGGSIIRLGSASGLYTNGQTQTFAAGYTNLQDTQDIDGDGDLDIIATQGTTSLIALRLNNGSGNFTAGTTFSGGATPSTGTATARDFDGDGIIDILSQNDGIVSLHRGLGNAQFAAGITSNANIFSNHDYRDVNNDGRIDIILADSSLPASNVHVIMQNQNGTFEDSASSNPSGGSSLYGYFDANSDGMLDFISANLSQLLIHIQDTEVSEEAATISMRSQSDASNLIAIFDGAIQKLSERRASIGATTARLESASNNALLTAENLSQAKSQLLDLDYANETAELARLQILQQAQAAVLTQANQSLRAVLSLLQGVR